MAGQIINRGVIKIDIEMGKVEIPTPAYETAIPKQKEVVELTKAQEQATQQVKKSVEESDRAQQRANEAAIRQQHQASENLERMSRGFMQVSRAAVLLGFSQDESLQKLIKNLALVHAGFDLFEGSRKIIRGLSDTLTTAAATGRTLTQVIGSGNLILGAGALAVTALAAAWAAAKREQQEYAADAERMYQAQKQIEADLRSLQTPQERLAAAQGSARNPTSNISGITADYYASQRRQEQMELLDAFKAVNAEKDKELVKQQESIQKAKTQLDLAQQRLQSEKNLVRSVQASFSQLESFEQKQLLAAAEKLRRGEDITEAERKLFEKAGEGGIAEASRAREGVAEGADRFIDSVKGLDGATTGVTGSVEELQKNFDKLNETIDELTSGQGFESAINSIEQQRTELVRELQKFQTAIITALGEIRTRLKFVEREKAEIAGAIQADSGRSGAVGASGSF